MMNEPKQRLLTRLGLALFTTALLAACASTGGGSGGASVETRAQEHLDLIIAQDFEGAFEYLSPGYRSGISVRDYQRKLFNRKAIWKEGTVGKSDCSEDACKVRISVKYVIYGALPGVGAFESFAAVEEDWVRIDGTWYLVPST